MLNISVLYVDYFFVLSHVENFTKCIKKKLFKYYN